MPHGAVAGFDRTDDLIGRRIEESTILLRPVET